MNILVGLYFLVGFVGAIVLSRLIAEKASKYIKKKTYRLLMLYYIQKKWSGWPHALTTRNLYCRNTSDQELAEIILEYRKWKKQGGRWQMGEYIRARGK